MSDAQDMVDIVAIATGKKDGGRWYSTDPQRNLILESEHLPTTIDLAERAPNYGVRMVVVTRYCVLPVEETGDLSPERVAQLRGWLSRREDLFRAYTLPSMLAQQQQPTWLLLVDTRLMHIVGPAIEADLPSWAYIVPVPPGRASSSILDDVVQTDRWTVAARLDNDDAVAVDFVKALAVWQGLSVPAPCLLSFPVGLQHDTRGPLGYRTRLANSVTGHFSALAIPPGGRLNAALGYMHTNVYRADAKGGGLDVPVRQLITTQPMWVEVLHSENLANHVRPGPTVAEPASYWRDRFGTEWTR